MIPDRPVALDRKAADGTRVRIWRQGPADAEEAVVFVHGATYGGRTAFAPPGYSWLAEVAATGRAAYAADARGYGGSERPPELEGPPVEADPVVRAETAATDHLAAVRAARESAARVHLVGYSWGTMVAGLLVTERGVPATSLTQYAPVYAPAAERRSEFVPEGRAYRTVTEAETRRRWAEQRPDDPPAEAFAAFWGALAGSGQAVEDGEGERVLAPNGTLADLAAATEAPLYDAGAVGTPTLVVRGSLDTASRRADALGLYDALGTDRRAYTELAGGTHFAQFESVRADLVDTVRRFQDRAGR